MTTDVRRSRRGRRRASGAALALAVALAIGGTACGGPADARSKATVPSTLKPTDRQERASSITLTPASKTTEPKPTVDTVSRVVVPTHVAVVGDSLTVASQDLIEDSLKSLGVKEVMIDGIEGRRMTGRSQGKPPGIEAVEEILGADFDADLWVIELGTNDVGAQVQPESFRDDMKAILSLLPPQTPVVWVNVHLGHHTDATAEANDIIDSVVASRRNASVADWHGVVSESPELLTDDGVHLRSRGEVAYSLVISRAVADSADN